jgi:glyoxylase-like metal-dependent hydrolase (beta-lactamase superfamily II)
MQQKSASVAEIGPGVYRVATYHERLRSSVNQYLIAGDEPALISTGLRESFAQTWAGIAEILDPATLKSILIPHFESDECGALNEFLERAPRATALASMRSVIASLADFAVRPPRGLGDGEVVVTGGAPPSRGRSPARSKPSSPRASRYAVRRAPSARRPFARAASALRRRR